MNDKQISLFKNEFPQVLENELMSKHTNLNIGGLARLYLPVSISDLEPAVELAKKLDIQFYILGGGSNLLVSDDGFDGLVLQTNFRNINFKNQVAIVEAGAILSLVAREAAELGLTGLEWGIGIPGTVGGAVYGNAGAWGGETGDVIVTVDVLDTQTMERRVLTKADCKFLYRESLFKKNKNLVILKVMFGLKKGDSQEINQKMENIVQSRKDRQPLDKKSAGCMFKNYEFQDEKELDRLKANAESIPQSMLDKKSISAGWLVEQVGMKGERLGNVQVSEKHANFIVNLGNARAQDYLMLTSKIKMKIRDEYNIMLQDEVQLLGF